MAYDPNNDGAAPAAQPPQQTGYGHPVYDQIGQYFQQATGRQATPQEVSQWGTNVDPNYMNTIRGAIFNTDEAKKYAASQNQPAPTTQPDAKPTADPPRTQQTGSPVTADGKIPQGAPTLQTYTAPSAVPAAPAQRVLAPMNLPTTPIPTYDPAQFSNPVGDQQTALMRSILTNPQTLSPSIVAQMKEQGKGDALLMQQQQQQQMDQGFAARGTLGSGAADALRARLGQDTVNNILTGNRNLDITAAQTNRQNELDAMNAGNAYAGQNLAYQGANADQGYKGYESRVAAVQDQVQRALAQFGVNAQVAANGQQNYGQDLGAFFNLEGLRQGAVQTNNSSTMALLNYLENQRQFNDNLGFNYNSLDQSGQNALLGAILGR